MSDALSIRPATAADADVLVTLIDIASEGMVRLVWADMAEPGEDLWDVGRRRARRDEGSFTWRNAQVGEVGGAVVAAVIGYPLPKNPAPFDPTDMPPMFVPLQELEHRASGTWYINVLATLAGHRGRGYGAALLNSARARAGAAGCGELSLIAHDANPALRLYARAGFHEADRRPVVAPEGFVGLGQSWVLLRAAVD